MKITLNITPKTFNYFADYSWFLHGYTRGNSYIFFDFPPKIEDGIFEFELMNFGISMDYDGYVEKVLKEKSPYFDDVVNCIYQYKNMMIFGKAKFKLTNVKGVDVCLSTDNNFSDFLYYGTDYRIEKGDFKFQCGGKSAFSPVHGSSLNIITNKDMQATITFSSDDYILLDRSDEEFIKDVASKQTTYDYESSSQHQNADEILKHFTTKVAKTFDWDFRTEYFWREYDPEDEFRMQHVATKSELVDEVAEERNEKTEKRRGLFSRVFKK